MSTSKYRQQHEQDMETLSELIFEYAKDIEKVFTVSSSLD